MAGKKDDDKNTELVQKIEKNKGMLSDMTDGELCQLVIEALTEGHIMTGRIIDTSGPIIK